MDKLAQRLRTWRAVVGITQAEAADDLGVSLATYNRWECERSIPPYREWQRINAHVEEAIYVVSSWLMVKDRQSSGVKAERSEP